MFILKAESEFDSAHFLSGYEGKCSNVHGHRWRIIAEVQSEELQVGGNLEGMVVDFGDIKRDLRKIADSYDHALIYQKGTMRAITIECLNEDGFNLIEVDFRPTAEQFAFHFYNLMTEKKYDVKRVTVYETPTNCAVYER